MGKENEEAGEGGRGTDTNIDRGYAWVVMIAVFLNHIIVDGIMYSFGIFQPEFGNYFEASNAKTALVGSTLNAVCLMSAPIASVLVNRFDCRKVAMVGGVIATIGCVSSTFCTSINGLLITYGVITGFGLGMVYLPSVVAVTFYFEKRRGLATGIAVCGTGVGGFLFAPLGDLLLRWFDWKNAMLFVAGVTLQACFTGALLRPLKAPVKPSEELPPSSRKFSTPVTDPEDVKSSVKSSEVDLFEEQMSRRFSRRESLLARHRSISGEDAETQMINKLRRGSASILPLTPVKTELEANYLSGNKYGGSVDKFNNNNDEVKDEIIEPVKMSKFRKFLQVSGLYLLADPFFLIPFLTNLVACVGLFVPFFYIVSKAQSHGIHKSSSAFLLSIIGIANTIGRIGVGFVGDFPRISALILHNGGLVGAGVLCVMSMFARSYVMLSLYAVTFGLCFAAWMALTSVVLCELLGLGKLTHAFGLLTMARGTATLLGPPLAGYIYDITLNYDNAMHVGGIAFILGGLISCILHLPYFQRNKASRDPDCVFCCPSAALPPDSDNE